MGFRLSHALIAFAAAALVAQAAPGITAGELLSAVRAQLKASQPDAEIARAIHEASLTERLDGAVVEELESEGVGPQALEELDRQTELTQHLAPPAQPLPLFDAPAVPTAAEQTPLIEATRATALAYAANLPNFLCTETVHRFRESGRSGAWKLTDTLKLDMAYAEKREGYKLIEINGRPATKSLAEVGGYYSTGDFGTLLKFIFAPESAARFQWERWTRLRGRLSYVFSYRVEQAHSQYTLNWNGPRKRFHMVAGFSGRVYIDRETGQIMRYTDDAEGIPADWPVLHTPSVADYDFAEVGGKRFLLPRRVDTRFIAKDRQDRNLIEFTNYRKFEGEATVTFDK
jgi:hypothetical protein